jgi:hypothetical protein
MVEENEDEAQEGVEMARDMKSDVSQIGAHQRDLRIKGREECMVYIIVWFMIFTK